MKRDALASFPFFRPLGPDELDALVAVATEQRVARNTAIFQKGDEGHSLMAVMAGRVRVGTTSADGKEVTHRVIGPGEIFGEIALLDGKPRSASAIASEDTTLLVLDRSVFLPLLMRDEQLLSRVLTVLCDRLRTTTRAVEDMALKDLGAKLARALCRLAEDYGRPLPGGRVRIDLKVSDADLGTLIGNERESVNKQRNAWVRAGFLARDEGYHVLCNPQALRRIYE